MSARSELKKTRAAVKLLVAAGVLDADDPKVADVLAPDGKPWSLEFAADYKPRWIAAADVAELVNLYHLARTALAGKPHAEQSRHYRITWAAAEFAKKHPEIPPGGIYKDLTNLLS